MIARVIVCSLLALGLTPAQNLLTNGDFEQELTVGWNQEQGGSGTVTFGRDVTYHPDPDYEAQGYLYAGPGWLALRQVVPVTTLSMDLSFWAAFELGGGSSTCWPVASIMVSFLDSSGAVLGETYFYYHNQYCTWAPSDTFHLIEVTNPGWQQYEMNLADELAQNLRGVSRARVRKVGVALYAWTSGG